MSNTLRIDAIDFYFWALTQDWPSMPGGYDVERLKELAPGYNDVIQATTQTIDRQIEHELREDAYHQQLYWLWVDRAVEAIGMLEADGLDMNQRGRLYSHHYTKAHKNSSHHNAFISLVKPNLDIYKSQIRESNVVFSATPNDPQSDAQSIADFNDYVTEILNANGWEGQREQAIHDFSAYGSGCFMVDHVENEGGPDITYLEERIRAGEVLDFDDYNKARNLMNAHKIRHVDTFEVIACRHASGPGSWDISGDPMHPYVHHIRNVRVAQLKKKYPRVAHKIKDVTSEIYRDTNPRAFVLDRHDVDLATLKTTYIRFPVEYDMTIPVRLADGDIVRKVNPISRSAILRVDRIEGVGIVDMHLDEYSHNMLPIVQAVNYESNKHSRGIGLCKYGYAPQKVHQIMFNGQLRMFERMVKGGGWFFKGVIDKKEIQQQQKEGTWIGIDRSKLPADLQTRPIKDLVAENQPMQFPSIYSQIQAQAERYVNTSMSTPPSSKGYKQGSSARQDLALINQADQVSSVGARNFEKAMLPLGKMVHSNIIQFNGEIYNIEFVTKDNTAPQGTRTVILNQVINESVQFDPMAPEESKYSKWNLFPTRVRNGLRSLRFSTQLSSRSLVPTNPTERRLYMSDFIQRILPMTETTRGVELLEWLVDEGIGGMPGFDRRIERIRKSLNEDRQFQQQLAQAEQQREQQESQADLQFRSQELAQNLKRLEDMEDDNMRENILEGVKLLIDAQEKGIPIESITKQLQSITQI